MTTIRRTVSVDADETRWNEDLTKVPADFSRPVQKFVVSGKGRRQAEVVWSDN